MAPQIVPQKRCSRKDQCLHPESDGDGWLPASDQYFHKQKAGKYGIASECIACTHERHARDYRETDPEVLKARSDKAAQQKKARIDARRTAFLPKNDAFESWQPIPGFNGWYYASNLGHIRSVYGIDGDRILRNHIDQDGYCRVRLVKSGGKRKAYFAHRLVMLAFVGECPDDKQVNHKNGVKTDNSLINLEYCTLAENIRHAFATGLNRMRQGEDAPGAKLTDGQVKEIKILLGEGIPARIIADMFHVSRATISRINTGKMWVHINV